MIKTFMHVYFDEKEKAEIVKRLEADQYYLDMTKDYNGKIEALREQIKQLEEERSRKRTKLIRKIQYEFYKEKREGS